ncbi:MAG: peptidoglycan DD-metalloendopeptidase family protein [Bacteroidales bacterium]|nr:peptidoglycan DD-metalloendopeptidase family protein [Bacteroidales bacterium]
MKRFSFLILPLLCALSPLAKAQDFYDPYANPTTSQDTIKILPKEAVEHQHQAIDTIPSSDKYIKIVLYDDYTWEYIDEGHPVIDTSGFYEGWSSEMIHAFSGESLSSFPDSVDLLLVDSTHNYCAPYLAKVHSGFKFRGRRPHYGVDLPLSTGDTIRAAFDGIVRYSGRPKETGGYGNLIVIRHDNGLETYYGHLSEIHVNVDDPVKAGECIGLGGSTGRSTGPHLHFETRYHGKPFDPQRVFDFENGVVRDSILTIHKHYFNIHSHYGQTDKESKSASGNVYYKVKKGDNLGKIAKRYGTTVNTLCRLNKIKSTSVLRVGQRLLVRKGTN